MDCPFRDSEKDFEEEALCALKGLRQAKQVRTPKSKRSLLAIEDSSSGADSAS